MTSMTRKDVLLSPAAWTRMDKSHHAAVIDHLGRQDNLNDRKFPLPPVGYRALAAAAARPRRGLTELASRAPAPTVPASRLDSSPVRAGDAHRRGRPPGSSGAAGPRQMGLTACCYPTPRRSHLARQPRGRCRGIWGIWPGPVPSSSAPCRSANRPWAPTTPTSASRSNLGLASLDPGDLAGARTQLERALQIHEQALGLDHPYIGHRRANLGLASQDPASFAGARALSSERGLQISEQALGPDHPYIGKHSRPPRATVLGAWGSRRSTYLARARSGDQRAGPGPRPQADQQDDPRPAA